MKSVWPDQQKVNLQYNTKQYSTIEYKKNCMNMGLLKHGSTLIASWWLKKVCRVSILIFHAGIAGDRLQGHYILPLDLTGAVYHDLLWNVLPELMEDVDLETRICL